MSSSATRYAAGQAALASIFGSSVNSAATRYSADQHLSGTKYGADKSYDASKYASDINWDKALHFGNGSFYNQIAGNIGLALESLLKKFGG